MQSILLRKAILSTTIVALLLDATAGHRLLAVEPQPAFRMACIFTDHMVLQRDQPLPVWGWAAPGRVVIVEVGPHSSRTRTNAEGRWRLTLPRLESGKGSLTMTVKAGDETIRLTDILVGEVWLCSGQSNMEMTVHESADGKAEVKAANHPSIRLFNIPRPAAMASDPQDDVVGQWQACSPESIADFSAVGYYFGREIHQSINVPVGLISASWGGTIIETWTRHEEISRLPGMTERIADAQDIHRDPTVVPQDMTASEKRAAEIHLADFKSKAEYKLAFKASQELAAKSRQAFNEARANDALAHKMTRPDLDLSSWKIMEIPNRWGEAGLPDFRGMVWFRKTIDVPASWAGKHLVLHLDRIYEGDVTWFNGEQVGATIIANYSKQRVYSIPANLIKTGDNTITVRVVDTFRPRGMSGKADAMALCVAGSEETDRIGLAGSWYYKPGVQLRASLPYPDDHVNLPTLLYNTMIHPLVPFGIRGIIWYQGENNHGDGMLYFDKMQALIQSWRNVFLRPDAPFYFVQIAPYRYGGDMVEYTLPELWEAQTAAMDIPHTGMAVISDIGHVNWLHPSNKQGVGKRLALWALAKDYGQDDLVYSGPLYKSMAIEGSKIRLSFNYTGSGLVSRDAKPLDWFEIAGEDGKFVKAQALIDGHTVVVSSDAIVKPTAARFAWHQVAVPNLMNKEGLPAGPFRTHQP
ncbi:sialate O-acetylesterase [Verrucomicrobia bacterium]|nr:sialate O-acetylesterase [Verrucomicrobiota bacterium]